MTQPNSDSVPAPPSSEAAPPQGAEIPCRDCALRPLELFQEPTGDELERRGLHRTTMSAACWSPAMTEPLRNWANNLTLKPDMALCRRCRRRSKPRLPLQDDVDPWCPRSS